MSFYFNVCDTHAYRVCLSSDAFEIQKGSWFGQIEKK